jgi:hypothetical protein
MTDASLPREVELAEQCSMALDEGNVEAAREHAEEGLRLATEKGSVKWMLRFKLLLAHCKPGRSREQPSSLPPEPLTCSFCGRIQVREREMVAGPQVFICEPCVRACTAGTSASAAEGIQRVGDPDLRCSFCARQVGSIGAMYARGTNRICSSCVETCQDIFQDRPRLP